MKAFVLGLSAICALSSATWAAPERIDPRQAMERSEAAVGRKIGNYNLFDSTGAALPLASYRGKPLVISLVYTSCNSGVHRPPST